jgi:hypothetical protein
MKTKQIQRVAFLMLSTFLIAFASKAQEVELSPMDTLANAVSKLQSDLNTLKKIKVSGYIQTQWQYIDSSGAKTVAGGDFKPNVNNRFMVRRGRVKFSYEPGMTQYVLQFDVTEKGLTIKDAYVKITEPWLKAFSLTAGMQNRPFGYEIPYSSSMRESPERGRMSQIIFPGERDLGAMITFQMPKTSPLNILKLEAGWFNGTGAPGAGKDASDFDLQKDFISHLTVNKTVADEKINFGVGVSYYKGGWRNATSKVYNGYETLANGTKSLIQNKDTTNYGKINNREYYGADLQLNFDFPFGMTTLRGEYIQGRQPAVKGDSKSPDVQPTGDTYIRYFNGAYFYFLQNIMQTKNQLIVKYDWYDPNTEVSGDEIGKSGSNLGAADILYTTLGLGWAYRWDNNVKITAYYDMVTNEKSKNLTGFTKDLKDNVFTLRAQYKF